MKLVLNADLKSLTSKNQSYITDITWISLDEIYCTSDSDEVLKINFTKNEITSLLTLPNDLYPTSIKSFQSKGRGSTSTQRSVTNEKDVCIIVSTDGKLIIINKLGKIEKIIEAHVGAILCAEWSFIGSTIATAGEDHQLKVWSKSGMLRCSLVKSNHPIHDLAWSPDSSKIVYCSNCNITIKPFKTNQKIISWRAHDGLVTKVGWNSVNNLIISGGEDCKYKLWDNFGRLIYSSNKFSYPIIALCWAKNGEYFCVASSNIIKLCNKRGWAHSLNQYPINHGSVVSLAWSYDSSKLAIGTGSGRIFSAHIADRYYEWSNYNITLKTPQIVETTNVIDDTTEKLDFKDCIVIVSIRYHHLIVITESQCFIYSVKNWNTPTIFDLKENNVSTIVQSKRHFLLVDDGNLYVYAYEGRLTANPNTKTAKDTAASIYTYKMLSLTDNTIAVAGLSEKSVIQLYDISVQKSSVAQNTKYKHLKPIKCISMNQYTYYEKSANDHELLAFIDEDFDLYLLSMENSLTNSRCLQLASMLSDILWNETYPILTGVGEGRCKVWTHPDAAFVDSELMNMSIIDKSIYEFGNSPELYGFIDDKIFFEQSDGSRVLLTIPIYICILYQLAAKRQWPQCVNLCQLEINPVLWTILAIMSIKLKNVKVAKYAFTATNQIHKIEYIQKIKNKFQTDKIKKKDSEYSVHRLSQLYSSLVDSEAQLLHTNNLEEATILNLKACNWAKAKELSKSDTEMSQLISSFHSEYLKNTGQLEEKDYEKTEKVAEKLLSSNIF
ncbi:Intraflagellar transport protein 80 [Intoshia linei]|uniref:Intraflagellar transport protein 80 n=1 Tax=Intoshia linei TaxID=1819745 RepID=A0A177AXF5_9BILA|nr:Intraflagellar transport protein 80 [Intoshia linei]